MGYAGDILRKPGLEMADVLIVDFRLWIVVVDCGLWLF